MGRILSSVPADRPWSWGPHLTAAFRDLGHEVRELCFRSVPDANAAVLRVADEFKPALHYVWKGERFRPKTFEALRRRGVYTVLVHPDETVPDFLPPLAKAADLFCTQFKGMMPIYRRLGIERMDWLIDGITPSFFPRVELTDEERQRYGCEIVSVGTVDRIPEYLKRLYALNRLIREGFHVKWWGRKLSLRRNPWRAYFSPARKAWGGGMVWNETFVKACDAAKIFFAMPRCPEISGGLSNRDFWTTGVGICTLTLYKAGIEELFEPGKEIVVFHDHDEMVEKARYYLAHDDERRAIAEAGRARTMRDYTNQKLLAGLLRKVAERGGPAL